MEKQTFTYTNINEDTKTITLETLDDIQNWIEWRYETNHGAFRHIYEFSKIKMINLSDYQNCDVNKFVKTMMILDFSTIAFFESDIRFQNKSQSPEKLKKLETKCLKESKRIMKTLGNLLFNYGIDINFCKFYYDRIKYWFYKDF